MFTSSQVKNVECKISSRILAGNVEILSIYEIDDGKFEAYFICDGTNNKTNRGYVQFYARPVTGSVENFKLTNLRGKALNIKFS